jgi:hypothetical protein
MSGLYNAMETKRPGENEIRTFQESAHGFMAARADVSKLVDITELD